MNPARLAGETRTQAAGGALHDHLEPIHRRNAGRSLADELDEIALHRVSPPLLDDSAAEAILGCDERGLPA